LKSILKSIAVGILGSKAAGSRRLPTRGVEVVRLTRRVVVIREFGEEVSVSMVGLAGSFVEGKK